MATNNEIQKFIELLGFTSKNKIQYQKEYKLQKYTLKIDLKKAKYIIVLTIRQQLKE